MVRKFTLYKSLTIMNDANEKLVIFSQLIFFFAFYDSAPTRNSELPIPGA